MSKISKNPIWRQILICALSGALLSLSFTPLSLWLFAWFAFVPLIRYVRREDLSIRNTILLGFSFGFFHALTSLYWIDIVLEKYGGLPSWASIPVLILLCGYIALYSVAFGVGIRVFKEGALLPFWLFVPSFWVVLEWLRGQLLTGFPWNLLAYSQTELRLLRQVADITGAYGVSWIVMFSNSLIVRLSEAKQDRFGWGFFILLLGLSMGYGNSTIATNPSCSNKNTLRVAIVQGNIDQAQKWDEAFRNRTVDLYESLSLQAVHSPGGADLIVWPESAMPFFYGFIPDLTARVNGIINNLKIPILFGSVGLTAPEPNAKILNKAYLVAPGTFTIGDYAKEHLVPFGEYVPLQPILFFVHKLVPTAGDFVPGRSLGVIPFKGESIGMLICYEVIFPELVRKRVLNGASFIVNISNDAWFGKSSAPYQHLESARWRAIETRRPIVRSTNTGISAFIDPLGNIVSSLGLFQSGFLMGSISPCHGKTFYVEYGDLFVLFCALIILLASLYFIGDRFGRRREVRL
ncbi:MAG: apolipoprotein N-acyltransferase [Syntrophobacterales bacterium]|nr:apolipoprotein N-acyltransferase [Syntrophobacterales bacterium]